MASLKREKAETKRIVAFTVARMKFLLNFQTQKKTQERIIVESFLLSARLQVRQPSLLDNTVSALISVIHAKVYDKIQREVSKKKLDSLTSVAAVHESQRPKLVDERDEVFYADLVATQLIKLQEQSLTMTLDGKKEEQSCPNDKRNELCVSMAINMKDDKSSLQTLV